MKPLHVTVLDFVASGPTTRMFSRIMNANLASIMPQVVAVWCEEMGHRIHYECYTGFEDIEKLLGEDCDVVFISAFTRSALTAYAVSNLYRRRGAVTVLGGPHARCYPEDAAKYFDYVVGFTDRPLIDRILNDRAPHRPRGLILSAARQPKSLPPLESRWKFAASAIAKAPALKIVPVIGSMGCPYTCSFCIDSTVDYQPLDFDQLEADLRFLAKTAPGVKVGWHDPNFGVRFDDYLSAIERALPRRGLQHIAESSLALLSEPNLRRMQKAGFVGIMPGIESWYEFGNKSKTRAASGHDKVKQVAEHVNLILRHVPFVQTNFVLGLDCDEGPEPFELTKKFIDLAPGAYPAFSMFTAYGRAAPLNLDLQRAGRVIPFPFMFLDSTKAMNVRPANYGWDEFYDHNIDLVRYAWSGRRVWRRLLANTGFTTRMLNMTRAMSSKRIRYQTNVRRLIGSDVSVRRYFQSETVKLPEAYRMQVEKSLGALWPALPGGAVDHDHQAYLNSRKIASA